MQVLAKTSDGSESQAFDLASRPGARRFVALALRRLPQVAIRQPGGRAELQTGERVSRRSLPPAEHQARRRAPAAHADGRGPSRLRTPAPVASPVRSLGASPAA